jgi:TonB family protein
MTPLPSQAPGAFETPRLAVHWEGRRANFLESLRVALRGPRAPRDFDPAKSFFRLRVVPGRPPGRGIAGSFLWHVLLLSISIPLSRIAAPRPQVALPQIEITWYGPSTDVAPTPTRKPKKPKPKPKTQPRPKPRRVVVARAYNPKTTVIFNPPHATSTRQVLIEPEAPPELPKSLPPLPNIISWAAEAPITPAIAARIFARRRKSKAEAMLRAPEMAGATPPAGPIDIAPGANAAPKAPLTITPSAIRAKHAASSRATAASVPSIVNAAPATGQMALGGSSPTLQPPLPPAPGAVRARRKANATRSTAAPNLTIAAHRIVALSLSPGNAPPPPGNASAPISIGPHVAPKVSAAASNPASNEESGASAPGMPAAGSAVKGPEGLLILHDANAPAPPPPPAPKPAKALPKIAPITPKPVRSLISPRPAHEGATAGRVVRHSLAHRVLGPWRIHTLLMNMPNLTSSNGSWVLNFADPLPVRLKKEKNIIAPLPVHSVDPRYPPDLKQEGIQGTVVLFAVIGRDGSVSKIRVVQSLDPVLDHNAKVAFSEWKFEPALLDNQPIALQVIVTVPFHYSVTQ